MSAVLNHRPASPFAGLVKPATKRQMSAMEHIDPDMLKVEHNVPPPDGRARKGASKYDDKFKAMKPGSCIRCEPKEVSALAMEMRKAIKSGKYPAMKDCTVVQRRRCDDGHGRVWLTKPESA